MKDLLDRYAELDTKPGKTAERFFALTNDQWSPTKTCEAA